MKKYLALLICCILPFNVAAKDCGAPKPIKPLEGLIDESKVKQGDASVIENISGKRVALIVSPNAEKQLAWNESLRQPLSGIYRLSGLLRGDTDEWNKASRETYDPKLVVDRMVAPFVSASKQAKLMSDLAEFRESGFELVVVLDINFKCSYEIDWSGVYDSNNEIEIVAYPLSPVFVMGPAVYGRSKFSAKYEPGVSGTALARQDAVNMRLAVAKDFQANVARAYPSTKDGTQPTGIDVSPTGVPDQKSVQARLQAVEDLRKSGLIPDKEAEAKRKEILNGL